MPNRWECPQCGKRNEEINFSCQRCGQARDTTPESPDRHDAHSEGEPESSRGRLSWLKLWWIPLIIVAIFAMLFTTDVVSLQGEVSVHDLRVGDCFDLDLEAAEEVDVVQRVSCDQAHEFEVFVMGDMRPGLYPTDNELDDAYESICLDSFEDFIGSPYFESEVWVEMLYPLPQGWDEGDRTITCFVFVPDETVTGTLENTGR